MGDGSRAISTRLLDWGAIVDFRRFVGGPGGVRSIGTLVWGWRRADCVNWNDAFRERLCAGRSVCAAGIALKQDQYQYDVVLTSSSHECDNCGPKAVTERVRTSNEYKDRSHH